MPNHNNDDDLADGLGGGDPAAGDAYSDRFRLRLIKYAMSRSFAHHEAEDLAQEALARGFQNMKSFRRGESMIRWLAGIERHLMLQEWETRSHARPVGLDEIEADEGPAKYRVVRPTDATEAKELATFWAKAQLYMTLVKNKRYVSAVQLHYIDQLSYAEVAQALGLANAETARQYVIRGLRTIRDMDKDG